MKALVVARDRVPMQEARRAISEGTCQDTRFCSAVCRTPEDADWPPALCIIKWDSHRHALHNGPSVPEKQFLSCTQIRMDGLPHNRMTEWVRR